MNDIKKVYKLNELIKLGYTRNKIANMLAIGKVVRLRYGYYSIDSDISEAQVIIDLFPNAVLCGQTVLFYYGLTERSPSSWNIAIEKNTMSHTKFEVENFRIKPQFFSKKDLEYGIAIELIDGIRMRMFDKERILVECIKQEKKMDTEIFRKAFWFYMNGGKQNIANLLEYAEKRKCYSRVKEIIELWP